MFDKSARTKQLADWLCTKLGKDALKNTVDYGASNAYTELASHVVY